MIELQTSKATHCKKNGINMERISDHFSEKRDFRNFFYFLRKGPEWTGDRTYII